MTEPLSIASSTLAVITAVSRTTSIVYKFIRDCKGAREDLTQITGELSELTLILKLIKDESAASTNDLLPNAIQIQVQAMLTGCTISVRRIEKVLAKCRGSSGPLRWTVLEKEKVTALKSSLEAFKGGLSLALETLNLSMTREIKNNTKMIQDNTTEIKHDTTEILDEIYRLRNQLLPGAPSDQERLRLEQWLDNLTHYAETIVASNETDAEIDEDSDVASFFEGVQEQSQPDDDAAAEPSTSITSRTGTAGAGNEIPVQHGDSKPCSSGILSGDYCKSLDIWATIHKDSILRLWSPLRREALVSLLVLQDGLDDLSADAVDLTFDNMALQFCPAKPELILIELPCHKVEVWDWKQKAKIKMAPEARKMFKESRTRVNFVPRTTLIYAHDSKKYLMIVDLITPLRFEMISISHLTKQAHFRYMCRFIQKGIDRKSF
ncbi:hypothetical protein GQX73_g8049 [Xylaria multiplex]|uniref:Azaphilone pigments biosynthesis cluster protein L N-terminal domain-containing protein n=1 Tax=Xylaria multiplex TaxID=323545 RepID=A0A7C8IK68_9PEZI|nr:hypothetical protein GQX73_g8049 [Xylaria multiplex]